MTESPCQQLSLVDPDVTTTVGKPGSEHAGDRLVLVRVADEYGGSLHYDNRTRTVFGEVPGCAAEWVGLGCGVFLFNSGSAFASLG